MTERKISPFRKEISGVVIRSMDDPYDKEHFAWVDVQVDEDDIRRILVTQRYRQENRLHEGKVFSWKQWTSVLSILDAFTERYDITREMKEAGIKIGISTPPRD